MNIYECSCLSANLSPSGEFELCEVCRLEEEIADEEAAEQYMHPTGLTSRQKEEVKQIVESIIKEASHNPPCG